jgi:hypothetical protein
LVYSVYLVYKYARYITHDRLHDLAYPLFYSSTNFNSLTSLLSSCPNSLITNIYIIPKFVTLALPSLALSLKILPVFKSLIKDILYPNLIYEFLFLILLIKSTAFKRCVLFTISISLNREIISPCSRCVKKGLVYIILISLLSC